MNDETKDILFRDLAMRLPYGVYTQFSKFGHTEFFQSQMDFFELEFLRHGDGISKPILRPLSDLSDELLEALGYGEAGIKTLIEDIQQGEICQREYTLLIENHYDVNMLIERGMAVDVNTCETDPYK